MMQIEPSQFKEKDIIIVIKYQPTEETDEKSSLFTKIEDEFEMKVITLIYINIQPKQISE